jgi:Xaa-Pro aminopeptidase
MTSVADPPALPRDRLETVTRIGTAVGVGATLVSDPASVRWLGVQAPDGVHVLVGAGDAVAIAPKEAPLPGGLATERFDDADAAAEAAGRALHRVALRPWDSVAIEPAALPLAIAAGLGERSCPDVATSLESARARKDAAELRLIERAAALATTGQAALRAALVAGASELDLWAGAQTAMQHDRGGLVQAVVDLMSGPRTAEIGRPPSARRAQVGDPVLFDLAPRRDGYWADSCATLACGVPGAALRRRHDAVRGALDDGLKAARPGVSAGRVDAAMRAALARAGLHCPHHTGHGVGTAAQEPPWLVPGEPTVLQPGMVLALEPGAYADGIGVRLEHLAVVEGRGARPLTAHSLYLA